VVRGYGVSWRLFGGNGKTTNPTATKEPTSAAPMVRCISGTVTVDIEIVSQAGVENENSRLGAAGV
jgi:hypothetical protein